MLSIGKVGLWLHGCLLYNVFPQKGKHTLNHDYVQWVTFEKKETSLSYQLLIMYTFLDTLYDASYFFSILKHVPIEKRRLGQIICLFSLSSEEHLQKIWSYRASTGHPRNLGALPSISKTRSQYHLVQISIQNEQVQTRLVLLS